MYDVIVDAEKCIAAASVSIFTLMMFTNFRTKNLLQSIRRIVRVAKAVLRFANIRRLP